jgi:hypothetical protein
LLTVLPTYLGTEVTNAIRSTSITDCPLLICLSFEHGQITIIHTIKGSSSEEETLADLRNARTLFDTRLEMLNETNEFLTPISAESRLFEDVARLLQLDLTRIIDIAEVQSSLHTMQYIACKENVDSRVANHDTERILFHGCSRKAALQIINGGFDTNKIGLHGKIFHLMN